MELLIKCVCTKSFVAKAVENIKYEPILSQLVFFWQFRQNKTCCLGIINLNTNVMLEAKDHFIFSESSILQQKFENVCKIWVVDAGYLCFNNCFYFITVISTFNAASLIRLVNVEIAGDR